MARLASKRSRLAISDLLLRPGFFWVSRADKGRPTLMGYVEIISYLVGSFCIGWGLGLVIKSVTQLSEKI